MDDINVVAKNKEEVGFVGKDDIKVVAKKDDDEDLDGMDDIKVVAKKDDDEHADVDGGIPPTIWMLCCVQICTGFGASVYMSMLTLYIIDKFALPTVSVGYVMLTTASIATFANFGFLTGSKKIGMYVYTIVACLWFAAALSIATVFGESDNLWGFLATVCFGVGIGFGTLMSAFNSMAMIEANAKTRGRIAGIVSASSSVSAIIGPILHGSLYTINTSYPFYVGTGCCVCGALLMVFMIVHWPRLRLQGKAKDTHDFDVSLIDKENWIYAPDIPTKKDYMRLGKTL